MRQQWSRACARRCRRRPCFGARPVLRTQRTSPKRARTMMDDDDRPKEPGSEPACTPATPEKLDDALVQRPTLPNAGPVEHFDEIVQATSAFLKADSELSRTRKEKEEAAHRLVATVTSRLITAMQNGEIGDLLHCAGYEGENA